VFVCVSVFDIIGVTTPRVPNFDVGLFSNTQDSLPIHMSL